MSGVCAIAVKALTFLIVFYAPQQSINFKGKPWHGDECESCVVFKTHKQQHSFFLIPRLAEKRAAETTREEKVERRKI
jgi:hypothetical protein